MGATDLRPFEVLQGELVYTANLDPPAFEFGSRWLELQAAIYSHLGRFQLHLADIKVESTGPNPGDVSLACWMLNYRAVVRYRLDRVEAWSNSAEVANNPTLATEIISEAMQVLRAASPTAQVAVQNVSAALHGRIGGAEGPGIESFVTKSPGGSPPLVPSGVSFLCEFPSGDGRGSIVLERSAVVPEGTFLRIGGECAGAVTERDAVRRGIEFFQASAGRLGLNVEWRT